MKFVLVAYANDACEFSLRRIGKQARKLGIFSDVLLWRPKDLPKYITDSQLMHHSYGGGYWAWKPCIIWETLQMYDDETVVCYVDSGCTLKKGVEWVLYYELMKQYDAILFKYRDEMPIWEKFGSTSTKIKYWTKKTAIEFYDKYVGNEEWRDDNKVWGGLLFVKGRNNEIVRSWLDIVLNNPEVILDPSLNEGQNDGFAQHKHDQPTITALARKYKEKCVVLPELSESCGEGVAVYASRVRCATVIDYWILKLKNTIRRIIGERGVKAMKSAIK